MNLVDDMYETNISYDGLIDIYIRADGNKRYTQDIAEELVYCEPCNTLRSYKTDLRSKVTSICPKCRDMIVY